jgi:hypothetical protein
MDVHEKVSLIRAIALRLAFAEAQRREPIGEDPADSQPRLRGGQGRGGRLSAESWSANEGDARCAE